MTDQKSGLESFPLRSARYLAIVGTHPDTKDLAPFDDPEYEIWVFNEAPQAPWCRRWDLDFQMHRPESYRSPNNYVNKTHWDWLRQKHGKPILMEEVDPEVPDSTRYPLEEILKTVPGASHRWIQSSASFALVLGLYLGFKEIHVWGVELSSNSEYGYQLTNWVFWVGVAEGMGVKLVLHSGQNHFAGRLYGYDGLVQIEPAYFQERITFLEAAWRSAENNLQRLRNQIGEAMQKRDYQKTAALTSMTEDQAVQAGEMSGALAEARRYGSREDSIPRQEFEHDAAKAQADGEEQKALMWHAAGKAEYVWNVWRQTGSFEALQQLRQFTQDLVGLAYSSGTRVGVHKENLLYLKQLDARITAAGGQRAVETQAGATP